MFFLAPSCYCGTWFFPPMFSGSWHTAGTIPHFTPERTERSGTSVDEDEGACVCKSYNTLCYLRDSRQAPYETLVPVQG
jgi:hypothetical protein